MPRIKLLPHAEAISDKQAKRKTKVRILTIIFGIDQFDRFRKSAVKLATTSYIVPLINNRTQFLEDRTIRVK